MLCIASTHKSGSSLVASWLSECGLALSDGRLMGPGPGNPLGHFEDLDFFEVHAAAIDRQHPGTDQWKVTEGPTHFDDSERAQILALAEARRGRFSAWGWKDPRSCLFLHEYVDLLPDMTVLVLRREYETVVDSLLRRAASVPDGHGSKVSRPQAEAITRHHLRRLDDFLQRHPDRCLVFELEEVLSSDEHVFVAIAAALGGHLRFKPLSTVFRPELLRR